MIALREPDPILEVKKDGVVVKILMMPGEIWVEVWKRGTQRYTTYFSLNHQPWLKNVLDVGVWNLDTVNALVEKVLLEAPV